MDDLVQGIFFAIANLMVLIAIPIAIAKHTKTKSLEFRWENRRRYGQMNQQKLWETVQHNPKSVPSEVIVHAEVDKVTLTAIGLALAETAESEPQLVTQYQGHASYLRPYVVLTPQMPMRRIVTLEITDADQVYYTFTDSCSFAGETVIVPDTDIAIRELDPHPKQLYWAHLKLNHEVFASYPFFIGDHPVDLSVEQIHQADPYSQKEVTVKVALEDYISLADGEITDELEQKMRYNRLHEVSLDDLLDNQEDHS